MFNKMYNIYMQEGVKASNASFPRQRKDAIIGTTMDVVIISCGSILIFYKSRKVIIDLFWTILYGGTLKYSSKFSIKILSYIFFSHFGRENVGGQ